MEHGVTAIIPPDWERRPELLPALRVWVEGARRVLAAQQRQDRKPT